MNNVKNDWDVKFEQRSVNDPELKFPNQKSKYKIDQIEVGKYIFIPNRTSEGMAGSLTLMRKRYPNRHYEARTAERDGVIGVAIIRWEDKE